MCESAQGAELNVVLTDHARERITDRLRPFVGADIDQWVTEQVLAGVEEKRLTPAKGNAWNLVVKAGDHDVTFVCSCKQETVIVITVVLQPFTRSDPHLKTQLRAMHARRRKMGIRRR